MKFYLLAFVAVLAVPGQAKAAELRNAYLDDEQNVHVVTAAGKDIKLTLHGHRTNVALSPDGETAAWLVEHTWLAPGETEPGSSELVIYRKAATPVKHRLNLPHCTCVKIGHRGVHFPNRRVHPKDT